MICVKVPDVFKESLPTHGSSCHLYAFNKQQPNSSKMTFLKFGILLRCKLPQVRSHLCILDFPRSVINNIFQLFIEDIKTFRATCFTKHILFYFAPVTARHNRRL